jgi:hypothetical protein
LRSFGPGFQNHFTNAGEYTSGHLAEMMKTGAINLTFDGTHQNSGGGDTENIIRVYRGLGAAHQKYGAAAYE